MPVNNESVIFEDNRDIHIVCLHTRDINVIVEGLDYKLYMMDQELHYYAEEPGEDYFKLVDLRDFLLTFTNRENRV